MSYFSRGPHTYQVPMSMHAEQRERLLKRFDELGIKDGIILLQGGKSSTYLRDDTDHEDIFRQEAFFHYLFGVKEPDCFGAILVKNRQSVLFIPRLPDSYKIWMGKIAHPEHFKQMYEVDSVLYTDELVEALSKVSNTLYILHGQNRDSGSFHYGVDFDGMDKFEINKDVLYNELVELRTIKTQKELDLLRYVNKISSDAHIHVMKTAKPNMMEYQLEAEFIYYASYHSGSRHCSYTCICGSGENSSILHYGHAGEPNGKQTKPNEIVLLDMGAEYHCYASDITRSWPLSGKFDDRQRAIYQAVWNVQKAVFDQLKSGVSYQDMHLLALRVVAEELLKLNIIKGDINELIENNIACLFMPHGLGHMMGIDTHDVGGYPYGVEKSSEPSLRNLRNVRVLQPGMVVTIEPGIYFNMSVLEDALKDPKVNKYLNEEEIMKYADFGGVRIEDDVIITEDGYENMTTVPSKIEEIESILSQNPNLFPQ